MNRLIIVSPHFPPSNAPDMQRARQSLPYWKKLGWEVEVVAVHPEQVACPRDKFLETTFPSDIPIHRVKAWSLVWSQLPGLGTLGYRCISAIKRQLLVCLKKHSKTDRILVFFTTTQFPVLQLIPEIKKQHPQVKIAVDYQDPWVSEFHRENPSIPPPGGSIKYGLVQRIARHWEPRVLRHVDALISVSPAYLKKLVERYPWLTPTPAKTIPFSAAEADFDILQKTPRSQTHFNKDDGLLHWLYVGRGGRDMTIPCRALFRSLAVERRDNTIWNNLRIHFIGTDYAANDRGKETILPIAENESVADLVSEKTGRIPYSEALQCMQDADALFLPGSIDSQYSPSKIYPCILAQKPLLAIFHEQSPLHEIVAKTKSGISIGFTEKSSLDTLVEEIRTRWLKTAANTMTPETDWGAFEPYTAKAMTERLDELFQLCWT